MISTVHEVGSLAVAGVVSAEGAIEEQAVVEGDDDIEKNGAQLDSVVTKYSDGQFPMKAQMRRRRAGNGNPLHRVLGGLKQGASRWMEPGMVQLTSVISINFL